MRKRLPEIPIGPSIAYIPLTRGLWALVDVDSLPLLGEHDWMAVPEHPFKEGEFRAARGLWIDGKMTRIFLHQVICPSPDPSLTADHVLPGNPLNCLRSNLRLATRSEQAWNRRLPTHNKSGIRGVFWKASHNKWCASFKKEGKRFHVGYFDDKELALDAYRVAVGGV